MEAVRRYLVLFREPDGRTQPHSTDSIAKHREDWNIWLTKMREEGLFVDGAPLTLTGSYIKVRPEGKSISMGPYYVNGLEMIGGFLIFHGQSLDHITSCIKNCPVFDFGGTAEIREIME